MKDLGKYEIRGEDKMGFTTPSNYQEELTNDILAKVSEDKLKAVISKDGFSVPEGYFADLQATIEEQTIGQHKVVKLRPTRTSWMSYVAAACVILAASTFALFTPTITNESAIAYEEVNIDVVPTEEIISYLTFYSETGDLNELVEQLPEDPLNLTDSFSSEEIQLYLENSI